MLFQRSAARAVIEGGAGGIVRFCDRYLTAKKLTEHLEKTDPMSRKDLCRYLDVGESTLAGWLKADKIPRTAKHAIVLRLLLPHLQPLKEESLDPRLVESDSGYQICDFERDDDGEIVGRVIARGIPDQERGRLLLRGVSRAGLRDRALNLLKGPEYAAGFLVEYDAAVEPEDRTEALRETAMRADLFLREVRAIFEAPDAVALSELKDLLMQGQEFVFEAMRVNAETGLEPELKDCCEWGVQVGRLLDYLAGQQDGGTREASELEKANEQVSAAWRLFRDHEKKLS